jgi:NhaP-type Na+/H+ or K+/H+ antiporter
VVAIGYVSLDYAGGSGYLGAFLAGLVVGNMTRLGVAMHAEHEREVHGFAAILSDLVTTFVFLIVGANLPLDALADNAVPALAVIAVLILVARPLTVLACARPDRRRARRARAAARRRARERGGRGDRRHAGAAGRAGAVARPPARPAGVSAATGPASDGAARARPPWAGDRA